MKKNRIFVVLALAMGAVFALAAGAQQITGTPGSPSATTTIDGKQLPAPPAKFGGEIKNDALQSKPWWAPRIVPPKEAPNILLIITDDAGFAVPSTFGGVIPTPTMDLVAKNGLRYNNIHSTALCSPTRAALITGRNHHSAGFGVISEQSTGFPGYNSIIPEDKATIGRILLDNGYATSWFGKDHNTPAFAASQAGPFDQWPTGMGFEYFYGFVGGDANQWQPNLFRNTTQIYPFEGKPDWNLVTGMADDAIDYLNRLNQTIPSKPFFVKYAPGATHAPHHPTQEWVEKIGRHAPLRRGLEQASRADLRKPLPSFGSNSQGTGGPFRAGRTGHERDWQVYRAAGDNHLEAAGIRAAFRAVDDVGGATRSDPGRRPTRRACRSAIAGRRTSTRRRPGRRSVTRDVLAECLVLVLELGQARLDHVADRDDARQMAVFVHDRQMADPTFGHESHEPVDTVVRGAGDHVGRHDRPHGGIERRPTGPARRPNDVALGHDPLDRMAVARHDQGTDPVFAEHGDRVPQRCRLTDRRNVRPLRPDDRLNIH